MDNIAKIICQIYIIIFNNDMIKIANIFVIIIGSLLQQINILICAGKISNIIYKLILM